MGKGGGGVDRSPGALIFFGGAQSTITSLLGVLASSTLKPGALKTFLRSRP